MLVVIMSYLKKILLCFLCFMPLVSCSTTGNIKEEYFLGLDKLTLWNKLCQEPIKNSNDTTGTLYARSFPENINVKKGSLRSYLKESKINLITETFMDASTWTWQPVSENFRYRVNFDSSNKVINVKIYRGN